MPERHLAGHSRGGRNDHAVRGDVLDTPRGRAEEEGLSYAAFVDHFLVELTDLRALGRDHRVQAAVGDRPSTGHRQQPGTGPRRQPTGEPIPRDPGPQFGELIGGIAAGQQIEKTVDDVVGNVGKWIRSTGHRGHRFDG